MFAEFISFSCNKQYSSTISPVSCPTTVPYSTPGGSTSRTGGTIYPQTTTREGISGSTAPIITTVGPSGTPPQTNTSCTSLELIFVLDRSSSIVPDIYENNVTQFVIDLASKFSFFDEASAGNAYTRFGLIQFADNAEVSIPLGNYTRNDFDNQVRQKVVRGDGGLNNLIK